MAATGFASDDKVLESGDAMTGSLTLLGTPPLVIPAGAATGLVATSDATGNVTWGPGGGGTRTATVTVGFANADYICTGSHDGLQIQAAINSLPAAGGKVLIRPGTYDFNIWSDRAIISNSNITIEGESYGSVIFKASGTLVRGASRNCMLLVGVRQTNLLSNITVRNIVFDVNGQTSSAGLTLDGGSVSAGQTAGQIGLQNVLVENVQVMNNTVNNNNNASVWVDSGTDTAVGNRGWVDNITFRKCDVGNGGTNALWLAGTNITNVRIDNCYIHDNDYNGIEMYQYGGITTNANWTIERCRFERNMRTLLTGAGGFGFRDGTQTGCANLSFLNNYFGPRVNEGTVGVGNQQDYVLTPYNAPNLRITGNTFDHSGAGISLGYSFSGHNNTTFPLYQVWITDNAFLGLRSCFDPDSTQFMYLSRNIFSEIEYTPVIQPYSDHWPTVVEDNIFYDCNTADYGGSIWSRAVIDWGSEGDVIRNNIFIEDRLLLDPLTNGSLALTQPTVSGAPGGRTYYVTYTFSNDTGETKAAAEQTISITAGNVLGIALANGASPNWPRGARYINYYVGTSSGAETLQARLPLPHPILAAVGQAGWAQLAWQEPITGLVTGASLPGTNTTHATTTYAIFCLATAPTGSHYFAKFVEGNQFFGFSPGNEIYWIGSSNPILMRNNYTVPPPLTGTDGHQSSFGAMMADTVTLKTITADYTLTTSDEVVCVSGSHTITLPNAAAYVASSFRYTIKNVGTGTVTVATTSGQTIDGVAGATLAAQAQVLAVISDGANWQNLNPSAATPAIDLLTQRILSV